MFEKNACCVLLDLDLDLRHGGLGNWSGMSGK